jgi:hypothetical protein
LGDGVIARWRRLDWWTVGGALVAGALALYFMHWLEVLHW